MNADPKQCAIKFYAAATGQITSMWFLAIFKIIFSFTPIALLGAVTTSLVDGAWFNIFLEQQDYYFVCAIDEPGFGLDLYEGDWYYQKAYLK